ncbi:MAG: glycosyltransferase family 4 protein [Gemmatimonadota bacterium]|nr:glycosyltransferase family 4 protein [Gemmatimonadota bacterium]
MEGGLQAFESSSVALIDSLPMPQSYDGVGGGSYRILMVAPQPFFRERGTPFSVLHRIRALLRLGHRVELLTYPFGERVELPGLVVHRSPRPPGVRDVAIGPSVAKAALDVPLFARAARLIARDDYDLVHTHEEAGAVGSWARRHRGLPHLYDMHSSLPEQLHNFGRYDRFPFPWLMGAVEEYILAGSDAVVAISPSLAERVEALGFAGPVEVIENVLDFPSRARVPEHRRDDPRREAAWPEVTDGANERDPYRLLYTGSLEPYQGLELLIGALSFVDGRGRPVVALVVGGTEDPRRRLEDHAREARVADLVHFLPPVAPAAVKGLHQRADVLVSLRSSGTNPPLKLYEYLRAGKPILATDVPSHRQVLDPVFAELVAPEADAVAAGIARLRDRPERARRLASEARSVAERRYGPETYMRRLARIVDRVVAGR